MDIINEVKFKSQQFQNGNELKNNKFSETNNSDFDLKLTKNSGGKHIFYKL